MTVQGWVLEPPPPPPPPPPPALLLVPPPPPPPVDSNAGTGAAVAGAGAVEAGPAAGGSWEGAGPAGRVPAGALPRLGTVPAVRVGALRRLQPVVPLRKQQAGQPGALPNTLQRSGVGKWACSVGVLLACFCWSVPRLLLVSAEACLAKGGTRNLLSKRPSASGATNCRPGQLLNDPPRAAITLTTRRSRSSPGTWRSRRQLRPRAAAARSDAHRLAGRPRQGLCPAR